MTSFAPVPANALASVLLSLNDGLILHSSLDPTSFRWENVGVTVDTILGGLRKDTLSTRTSSTVEISPCRSDVKLFMAPEGRLIF